MANIIFDFDGTIADSLEAITEVFFEIMHRQDNLTEDQTAKLRGMSLIEIAEELKVPLWRMPFLVFKGRRAISKHMTEIKIFPDIAEVIKTIHSDGHRLFIMSSNSPSNVRFFLKRHEIYYLFEGVYGNVGLFNKAKGLKSLTERKRLKRDECFYVGDEVRDVEASNYTNVRCIAVEWGFSSIDLLKEAKPYATASKPADIYKVIKATQH